MAISETRTVSVKSGRPQTTEITTKIGYDFNRTLPTSVDEYATERSERAEQYTTVTTQTVLQLQSDSLAVTKNP